MSLNNIGTMRWAKSYSIIDHQLLHGGYLHRLSHKAMVLYLFLVVVGDREGKSFYADPTIMEILRLDREGLEAARLELETEGLIYYRRPYHFLRNIEGDKDRARGFKRKDVLHEAIRDLAKDCLKDISRG
jgi:hypothetical protein